MYCTVREEGCAEISVKHSKFLAFCAKVADEEEAETFLKNVRKRFTDATHAPYAYLIGEHNEKSRSSDDGEPSGTSGVPILEAIKNIGLTYTIVVVVRYFGGIKLGTGGLARAYGDAAFAALQAAGKSVFERCIIFSISCDYSLISTLQNQVYAYQGIIQNADYSNGAVFYITIPFEKKDNFLSGLADATSGKAVVKEIGEQYCEVK